MSGYFSDREYGPRPRTEQEISATAWGGLTAIINALVKSGAFGARFPEQCQDGQVICGCDSNALGAAVRAELPGLTWPLETSRAGEDGFMSRSEPWAPPTLLILDLLWFVWRNVSMPVPGAYHEYWRHHHFSFDVATGRDQFREDVNRMFARNGLAYEMQSDGLIFRLLPAVLDDAMRTRFQTGDRTLDVLLDESRTKFSSPDPAIRREALERLWDGWERLKSLADTDKKKSIEKIIRRAAEEDAFRTLLDSEARTLTGIGNAHLIRHHEIGQTPVTDVDHIDYLYHRLFAMIELLIRKNAPRP